MSSLEGDSMHHSQVKVDVEKALEITRPTYRDCVYSSIVPVSNENLEATAQIIDYKDKEVLLPASSGDQYLMAKFHGAKQIDLYDINTLTQYYCPFKWSAVLFFEKREECLHFLFDQKNRESYLNRTIVEKVSPILGDDLSYFWETYLMKASKEAQDAFLWFPEEVGEMYDFAQRRMPIYQDDDAYSKLREQLEEKPRPTFYRKDLYDLPKVLTKKYDVIDLSNIIECHVSQRYQQMHFLTSEEQLEQEEIHFIEEQLVPCLTENGKIIVDYRLHPGENFENCNDLLFQSSLFDRYLVPSRENASQNAVLVYQKKQAKK